MRSPSAIMSLTIATLFSIITWSTPVQGVECQPGIILPVWYPQEELSTLEVIGRGIVYLLALLYMFVGVSVISDRFMGSIEVITSKQKEIKVKRQTGETKTVVVRVWNETVANLTLMALGSSAPEILLSVIEIVGKDFEAGDLGPGTIVGSAAFNFFVIIAICILSIPKGEVRKIKHLRVFIVTCSWSLFAYVWLLVILKVTSPGIVEIWEGALTFAFFFATVLTAFIADKRLVKFDKLTKTYRLNKRGVVVEGEANTELGLPLEGVNVPQDANSDNEADQVRQFEQHRKQYVELLWDLHERHPDIDLDSLEVLAREEIFNRAPKSRAFYRIQATRKLVHGQNLNKKLHNQALLEVSSYTLVLPDEDKYLSDRKIHIGFNPTSYTVMENVGTFAVTLVRQGGNLKEPVMVDYATANGTALANDDYIPVSGTVTFGPDETFKEISIQVLDDDVFEEDEHFFINLTNPRLVNEMNGRNRRDSFDMRSVELIPGSSSARVTIVDDDYAGTFYLPESEIQTNESVGTLEVKVGRASGGRGKVVVPYTTVEGSAKSGTDFKHLQGNVIFENNEPEKTISIPIIERNSYEKNVGFYLEISNPMLLDDNDVPVKMNERVNNVEVNLADGYPKLGENHRALIVVKESSSFKNTVDKLLQKDLTSAAVATNSWKEQFIEAVTIESDEDDGEEKKRPSVGNYIIHILTVFWKVLFAFVPPTSILDGYLTFFASIIVIGILTAFIGDIASHLGCTVGLKDSITAIVFVALGTSVPDTFASKVSAVQDEFADASIGNVTGSNAVNVFLGIGIAWLLAAIVKACRTCSPELPDCNVFRVDPGSLAFSVSLFCASAVVGVVVLMMRRLKVFGDGELGGPPKCKYGTAFLFIFLWLFYVVMSSLEAYKRKLLFSNVFFLTWISLVSAIITEVYVESLSLPENTMTLPNIFALWLFLTLVVVTVVNGGKCQAGMILPAWWPQENLSTAETAMRGTAYFLAMMYLFVGVSIISDRFMGAIEVITSKEKEIKVHLPDGGVQIIVARVWNETVANLTLMALGSSAPEILLSIIEIMGKLVKGDFESGSGELGPGTIVGSAAFNLLCIIAICIYVIPDGEVRSINHLNVFFVTATWSVFAYIWLLLILTVISPGVVEIWEGVLTFLFFPLTVVTSYIADRRIYKYLSKSYRLDKRGIIVAGDRGSFQGSDRDLQIFPEEATNPEIKNFEQTRRDYILLLRKLRKKFPDKGPEELEQMAKENIYKNGPKSRAFYRMQATRKLIRAFGAFRKSQDAIRTLSTETVRRNSADEPVPMVGIPSYVTGVYFNPGHYTVMESVDSFEVTVMRHGGDLYQIVMVDYKTEDGSATADTDYIPASGTLTFGPGETHKSFRIKILDDDIYEEDEHFYIHLSRARFGQVRGANSNSGTEGHASLTDKSEVRLINPSSATVMILDDDHAGIFNFEVKDVETTENVGQIEVKVKRWSGARGTVQITYATIDGTAKADKDYQHVHSHLVFHDGEIEKTIHVTILEEDVYQKDVVFYIQLSHPVLLDSAGSPIPHMTKPKSEMSKAEVIAAEGWPKLGYDNRTQIRLRESKQFKSTVDKLLHRANAKLIIGTSSWKEQFIDAVTIGGDEESSDSSSSDDDDHAGDVTGKDGTQDAAEVEHEEKEVKYPSFLEYVMHFFTIFWKVLFAFVPPTDLCGGYLAFFISILVIGVLTAIIGDVAAHFGCSVGLKDSVTAITFVALGTSIPDTFASKVAAVQDEYADASIGNVTGSNAVNVFLGIGIAWTIAPIFYAFRTCAPDQPDCTIFRVDPGSLAFSVTLFCTCAVVAIGVILLRRLSVFGGGELGGPTRFKYSTALLFLALWIFYVLMSSLEAYGKVQGF